MDEKVGGNTTDDAYVKFFSLTASLMTVTSHSTNLPVANSGTVLAGLTTQANATPVIKHSSTSELHMRDVRPSHAILILNLKR